MLLIRPGYICLNAMTLEIYAINSKAQKNYQKKIEVFQGEETYLRKDTIQRLGVT